MRDEPPQPASERPSERRPLARPPLLPPRTADEPVRLSLLALQRLVKKEDLSVVFQPIVDIQTGQQFATEALVRCRIPDLAYPPALFEHAVAERCCGRLGRMIREIAVPLCAGSPVFLNIHPGELSDRWLVRPDDPIFAHDDEIFLEITESVPFSHFELCLDVLREIRHRSGIHLVVDDLGAGYSNFSRIADLEPKVVKLDRELVTNLDQNVRRQQLVTSVVRLCSELGAKVVAEGIETQDECSAVSDTGVQYGQGYLFARPAFPFPRVTWAPLELQPVSA